jgi:phosphatidylinositol 3-kinase
VTAELLSFLDQAKGPRCPKRLLLYKHDDDLRQEMFAIQFISSCDKLLQASGLDLKLLTFRCIPVGPRRGFIEWIPGSVPLSDICQPFAGWLLDDNGDQHVNDDASLQSVSGVAKAGLTKYKCLRRLGGNQTTDARGSFANNPIQDYLRSVAYDPEAPYLIQTDVIGNYIKSCAGYCVITYLLASTNPTYFVCGTCCMPLTSILLQGVGDRHLDNLLLHHTGRFFHCDYSFILGNDPKKYLPVRITEDMIFGMGGRGSDNYAKFLSLTGATFLALRQPGNVCFLLSLVRSMVPSCLPDLASAPEDVILSIRGRLRLDLSEHAAVSFMEKLIETSLSSKMWLAVDAIHSLGKKF